MTWDEIAHLHQDGFEIGNHTRDHMSLNPSKPEVLKKQLSQFVEQLDAINQKCEEYGIPKTVSFAYPGNGIHPDAYPILASQGIRFARRGDHPLLIPSAGDARPNWELKDFKRAVNQARSGRIAVLQFHGVPDKAHPWVHSPVKKFESYMKYLSDHNFKVIALRDLDKYVDPKNRPKDDQMVIRDRKEIVKNKLNRINYREPKNDQDLKRWLENMVWHHRFTRAEIEAATGLTQKTIISSLKKFDIKRENKPGTDKKTLTVLPYPGGRHPRIGFLDGAIRPQRETKLSVFSPWNETDYFVLDIPEAIRRNEESKYGLLYLAHTHVDTMWTRKGIDLPPVEWIENDDGTLEMKRTLPNHVSFGVKVFPGTNELKMTMWLRNDSKEKLSGLNVQNCIMTKGAPDFCFTDKNDGKVVMEPPFIARRANSTQQWIISAWTPCKRVWENPPCPCLHSDPQFPDCAPGEKKELKGWFSFYEGENVKKELKRIQSLGWLDEK